MEKRYHYPYNKLIVLTEGKAPIQHFFLRHLIPFKIMYSAWLLALIQHYGIRILCVIDYLEAGNKQTNLKLVLR